MFSITILTTFLLSIKLVLIFFVPLLWGKIEDAFHSGNYEIARNYLGGIIWILPNQPQPYTLKAWLTWSEAIYLKNNGLSYKEKLDEAEKIFHKGQKRNPFSWQLYFEEAIMWRAFGEREKSLIAYSQAYNIMLLNKIIAENQQGEKNGRQRGIWERRRERGNGSFKKKSTFKIRI